MKKLILVLVLLFSAEHRAHAQSCINEGGSPPVAPQAQEVSSVEDYDNIVSPTFQGHGVVLVEFYLDGCCYYNGEVALVNELMQLYPTLKVIQVERHSEAGILRDQGFQGSPEFHLFVNNHEWRQVGAIQGNVFVNWLNNFGGLRGGANINPVANNGNGCVQN